MRRRPGRTSATATAGSSTTATGRRPARPGCIFSGLSPDGRLVEIAELDRGLHPWMLGTQFHPEFRSRPNRPHPLFRAFLEAVASR